MLSMRQALQYERIMEDVRCPSAGLSRCPWQKEVVLDPIGLWNLPIYTQNTHGQCRLSSRTLNATIYKLIIREHFPFSFPSSCASFLRYRSSSLFFSFQYYQFLASTSSNPFSTPACPPFLSSAPENAVSRSSTPSPASPPPSPFLPSNLNRPPPPLHNLLPFQSQVQRTCLHPRSRYPFPRSRHLRLHCLGTSPPLQKVRHHHHVHRLLRQRWNANGARQGRARGRCKAYYPWQSGADYDIIGPDAARGLFREQC